MPWTAAEAKSHTKSADTPKKKRQWSKVANAALKKYKNEGRAIRIANAAVGGDSLEWLDADFKLVVDAIMSADETKTRIVKKDPFGRVREVHEKHEISSEDFPPKKHTKKKKNGENDDSVTADRRKTTWRDPFGRLKATIEEEEDAAGVPGNPNEGEFEQNVFPKKKRRESGRASELGEWAAGNDLVKVAGGDNDFEIEDYVPQRIEFHDTIEFDDKANVHITQDGYLAAEPRIARVGVQLYRGAECGCDDVDVVRVYRPYDSVFATDSIRSLAHRPVTIEHPTERVTADNWKKYAVGHTGDTVSRDEDGKITSVRVPMVLMDRAAIQSFKDGKNQLSVGYTCDLDWCEGLTDDGEKYDAVQRNIRANHLAVVATARGGPTLRIGDDAVHKEVSMDLKTITIDGIACPMSDTAAQVVQRALKSLKDEYDAFKKKVAEEEEDDEEESSTDKATIVDLKKKLDAKDAEIVTLQKQLKDATDPALLDAKVKLRADTFRKAQAVLGDSYKQDGKTVEDVRRDVVKAYLGDIAKDWDENKISASFETITAKIGAPAGNTFRDAVRVFAQPHTADEDPRRKAWAEMLNDQANAWKGERKTA